jgi:hypothetical protein
MKLLKNIYFAYIKFFWYADTGLGEIRKSGTFVVSIMSMATFMKVFGISVSLWQIPIFTVLMIAISMGLGYLLVQKMETLKYMNNIVNKHNNELMDILESVKRIEDKLK